MTFQHQPATHLKPSFEFWNTRPEWKDVTVEKDSQEFALVVPILNESSSSLPAKLYRHL